MAIVEEAIYLSAAMYLLCLALFASPLLTRGASQETSDPDFTRPVLPADYQRSIKQGFATNYFKTVPAMEYRPENIQDIYDRGFRNLRFRVRADLYCPPHNNDSIHFTWFLDKLEEVVDRCLEVGVVPIISWIRHEAEAFATKEHRRNYVEWWAKVAKKLKGKNYRLSFNLFTELGIDKCVDNCQDSLKEDTTKYNEWTSEVVDAIRAMGEMQSES